MGEVAKDADKRRKEGQLQICVSAWVSLSPGQSWRSLLFLFIMAAVQTEVSLCTQPWQRSFYVYGGLACNSLMAGKFFVFLALSHFFFCYERNKK